MRRSLVGTQPRPSLAPLLKTQRSAGLDRVAFFCPDAERLGAAVGHRLGKIPRSRGHPRRTPATPAGTVGIARCDAEARATVPDEQTMKHKTGSGAGPSRGSRAAAAERRAYVAPSSSEKNGPFEKYFEGTGRGWAWPLWRGRTHESRRRHRPGRHPRRSEQTALRGRSKALCSSARDVRCRPVLMSRDNNTNAKTHL